jgi:hypothetical protein
MNGYAPEIGELVYDEATCQVGRVMGYEGLYWQLRPVGGGREWDASGPLRRPTDAERLSVGVAMVNARSRGEL